MPVSESPEPQPRQFDRDSNIARPVPPVVFAVKHCPSHVAVTAKSRQIPLFQYETLALPVYGQKLALGTQAERREFVAAAERRFLLNTRQDASQLVRLIEANPAANCHGWVFANGQFGIEESYVPFILEDQGYFAVHEPRAGDLAIYERGGKLIHSAVVGVPDRAGRILVESKWGPFGVYLHPLATHPFHGVSTFYRSQRPGRILVIQQA